MNVHPHIFVHPKYLRLRRQVGPGAMEYLCRLWGFCQTDHRGQRLGKVSAEYVEAICAWDGEAGKLFAALTEKIGEKAGFCELDEEGNLTVHDWDRENRQLVGNWRNGSAQKRLAERRRKGSALPGDCSGNGSAVPGQCQGSARAVPQDCLSNASAVGEHCQGTGQALPGPLDLTGCDLKESAARARAVRATASPMAKGESEDKESAEAREPVVPTQDEVMTFGNGPAGIPGVYCAEYWQKKQDSPAMWFDTRGNLIDWRHQVVRFWAKDRHVWRARASMSPAGKEVRAEVDQKKAELQVETDGGKRSALKKEIARLEGEA